MVLLQVFLYICFNAFNQKIIEIIFQRCHLLSPLFCQPHDIFLLFFNFSFSPELLHPFSWRNPRPHLLQLHSLIFWAFFDISKVQFVQIIIPERGARSQCGVELLQWNIWRDFFYFLLKTICLGKLKRVKTNRIAQIQILFKS